VHALNSNRGGGRRLLTAAATERERCRTQSNGNKIYNIIKIQPHTPISPLPGLSLLDDIYLTRTDNVPIRMNNII